MSNPTSILGEAIGFARDHAIDQMPRGLMWDMADFIPQRRGARLERRGPWSYFSTPAMTGAGPLWGGKHAAYRAGTKLIAGGAGNLYDIDPATGTTTLIAPFPFCLTNGFLLRDRVYFASSVGDQVPQVVTWNGTAFTVASVHDSAPRARLLAAYKDRLLAGGVIQAGGVVTTPDPSVLYFSPLETDLGPLGQWDVKSFLGTTRAITAIYPMTAQILVFHDGSIEKVRGSIPPATNVDTDMALEVFSEQLGTSDPASVVAWQENVCFASHHGIFLTDGSTIRSLTDQGGISDLWRQLYALKRSGTYVHSAVFLEKLFVTVLTAYSAATEDEFRPYTLVCDLANRTWFRLKNVHATCYIDSEVGVEEVWWGVDPFVTTLGERRLSKLSPMFFGPTEYDPIETGEHTAPDAIDGNGLPVLGHIRSGWVRFGPEGVKRMRHVYLSHLTQVAEEERADVYEVGARISPFPFLDPYPLGKIGAWPRYRRNRLRVNARGYGLQVEVKQVLPSYISRIYDIAVDQWPQDRGKL